MKERQKLGYYKDTKIMYIIFMNDMKLHHKVQTHKYIDNYILFSLKAYHQLTRVICRKPYIPLKGSQITII